MGKARGAGWTVITPVVHTPTVIHRPRVMAYVRQNTDLKVVQRTDLLEDFDIQILDIKHQGAHQQTVHIVNIYNVLEGGKNFVVDRLCQLQLDPTIPTIITGDWNLKHNLYRAMCYRYLKWLGIALSLSLLDYLYSSISARCPLNVHLCFFPQRGFYRRVTLVVCSLLGTRA